MRDQFRLLLALQQMDDRLRALALEEQQLPQRLQAYEAACAAVRQQLVQQQAAIEQSERQQRAFERELVNHQEAISKTQSKAHDVKTNKEYSAILAEIDAGQAAPGNAGRPAAGAHGSGRTNNVRRTGRRNSRSKWR